MDQACQTYPELPKSARKPCSGKVFAENEWTTSFGPFNKTDGCFHFARNTWTFGQPNLASSICTDSVSSVRFCHYNRATHKPCQVGAMYRSDKGMKFRVEKWGLDRISVGLHYPVLTIVDADGTKTKWYEDYIKYVSDTTTCKINRVGGCRRNQWAAEGTLAVCK